MRQYIGRLCLTGLCVELKATYILEFYEVKSVDNNKSFRSTSNRKYIPTLSNKTKRYILTGTKKKNFHLRIIVIVMDNMLSECRFIV